MKVRPGLGGRGTVTSIESMKHPNSHFEIGSMNIKKADDGSFVMEHRMELKKKHQGKEMYHGSYREPETSRSTLAAKRKPPTTTGTNSALDRISRQPHQGISYRTDLREDEGEAR